MKCSNRGQALIEFALIALVSYLILAATIEFGRLIFSGQVLQDSARVAAREIALQPAAVTSSFAEALEAPAVTTLVYDEKLLVIDQSLHPIGDPASQSFYAQLPVVNHMLLPLYVLEEIGGTTYLHFPGAVVTEDSDPTGAPIVLVPVVSTTPAGANAFGGTNYEDDPSSIQWLHVVEDFTAASPSGSRFPLTVPGGGLVTLRINYPFQSAMLSAYHSDPTVSPPPPNGASPILANDDAIDPPAGFHFFKAETPGDVSPGANAGDAGLGRLYAMGQVVRPFRRVLSAQAVFRREVFSH